MSWALIIQEFVCEILNIILNLSGTVASEENCVICPVPVHTLLQCVGSTAQLILSVNNNNIVIVYKSYTPR